MLLTVTVITIAECFRADCNVLGDKKIFIQHYYILILKCGWPRLLSRYSDSLPTGWSGDGIPVGSETFLILPETPWGPLSLLYNGYLVFPGGKERTGCGVDHQRLSSVKVKERVELYLYSPSGPLWPVLGWNINLGILWKKLVLNSLVATEYRMVQYRSADKSLARPD